MIPSWPTIVSAATSAFRIASSVASIVAQKSDVIASSGSVSTDVGPVVVGAL